jgi:hypothetical protein
VLDFFAKGLLLVFSAFAIVFLLSDIQIEEFERDLAHEHRPRSRRAP